jgi:WD40 repeat protein
MNQPHVTDDANLIRPMVTGEILVNDRRNKVDALAISPNGQWLVYGTRQGIAVIWNLVNGQEVERIYIGQHHNLIRTNQNEGRQVRWVGFTSDSQTVVINSIFGSAIVWNLMIQETVHVMQGYSPMATTILDDRILIAGATEPNGALRAYLRIGNLKTGRQIRTLDTHYLVQAIALSPTNNLLSTGHDKGDIKLWNWETGEYLTTYQHPCWVHSMLFHPTEPILISAGGGLIQDYTIQIWDCRSGEVVGILAGHNGNINGMAISPDGRTLVSASNDCKLKVWDLLTQTEIATLTGHWEQVTSVAFSADGRQIFSGGYDGQVRCWHLIPLT